MDIVSKKRDDGTFEVTFTGTEEELKTELLTETEQENDSDEQVGEGFFRKPYCCTCSNGEQHTIQASHSRSAAWKSLMKCKGGFSLRSGACI